MAQKRLSKRLQAVADLVPKGARLADIGADHAYVCTYLLKSHRIKYAVAGEVAAGPLKNATAEMNAQGLKNQMETRLSDGLCQIRPEDEIDAVVIAGMGGDLTLRILEKAKPAILKNTQLILEPNVDIDEVRTWLMKHQYEIEAERLVYDGGHYYEMLRAKPVEETVNYDRLDLEFGPKLRKQKSDVFISKWEEMLKHRENVLYKLENSPRDLSEKIKREKQAIQDIRSVLNDKSD